MIFASRIRAWLEGLEGVSLGVRLALLVAVPLAVIVSVSVMLIGGRWAAASESSAFSDELSRVALVQAAIRAVQAERETTIELTLATRGGVDVGVAQTALELARAKTDRAIADAGLSRELDESPQLLIRRPSIGEANAVAGNRGHAPVGRQAPTEDVVGSPSDRPAIGGSAPAGAIQRADAQELVGGNSNVPIATGLTSLRRLADQGTIGCQIQFSAYSNLVGQYQENLFESARLRDGSLLSASVVSYEQWQQAIEWFAQVRVLGFQRLVSRDLTEWQRLAQLSDSEELFVQLARQSAQPPESAALGTLLEEPGVLEGAAARTLMLSAGDGPPLISVSDWLDQTAVRLAALNSGADFLLDNSVRRARAAEASARRELVLIAAATALLTLLVASGAWAVTRSVSRPLHRLALTAQLASAGHLTKVDVPHSHDAIGEIGSAFDELRRRSDEMADSAEAIARGDLATKIRPRSGHDRLGWALRRMTQRLATMVTESDERSQRLAVEVGTLRETAHRDSLTGLANRRKFAQLLESGIADAHANGVGLGLLFIDLDGFKPINDTLGHDVGDELLRRVSDRLTVVVGHGDGVGRFGGDEFTVVVKSTTDDDDGRVYATARRVSEALAMPYEFEGRTVQLGASIGVARCPDHGDSADALLRAADQAMYEAKQAGGGIRVADAPEAAA